MRAATTKEIAAATAASGQDAVGRACREAVAALPDEEAEATVAATVLATRTRIATASVSGREYLLA